MSDAPTFGRYTEIPYDEMTPEQQEGSYPQACLIHQRQHGFTEEFKIGREIEEGDLNSIAPSTLEADQLVDHGLRAANNLNIAAECTVRVPVRFPSNCVT